MPLRLLVVEGNIRDAREVHAASWGMTPAGSYAKVLEALDKNIVCDICTPADEGSNLPDSGGLSGYDGVALTGSGLNIYDSTPEIGRQIDLARAVYASGTPFFGSCWGLQIGAVAAGGHVIKNPKGREAGFARNIGLTAAGREHSLLQGRPPAYDAPCVHYDIVSELPAGSLVLATNSFTPVQAAEIRYLNGIFWGVQYHPEFSLTELAVILERGADSLVQHGYRSDDKAVTDYCNLLRLLDAEPSRKDIAWQLGLGDEILDRDQRLVELRNWLSHRVMPVKSLRGRG